jgi:hypothetical protein
MRSAIAKTLKDERPSPLANPEVKERKKQFINHFMRENRHELRRGTPSIKVRMLPNQPKIKEQT